MAGWQQVVAQFAHDIETRYDEFRYNLQERMGWLEKVKIIAYNSYGNEKQLYIKGRVLEERGITSALDNDSLWENLVNTYKRLESDEVPGAEILVRFQDNEQTVVANEEGFFEAVITPTQTLKPGELWQYVDLELISPKVEGEPVRAQAKVLIPPPTAEYVVISDVDDTVLISDATHLVKMARNVFLSNSHTRLPFPGVAALYRSLFHGSKGNNWNPLFYVSSSPWNLYDLLVDFFALQDIPIGPVLFLRDWGLTENELLPLKHHDYKLNTIRQMLKFYPELPFILIGDSGQEDPEIYAQIIDEFPNRILATYIRNVRHELKRVEEVKTLAKRVVESGSDLILADETSIIAEHAIKKGWIEASRFGEILGEKAKDEAPPSPIEKLIGEKEEGPAIQIEAETPAEKVETKAAIDEGLIEDSMEEAGDSAEKPPTVILETKPDENADQKDDPK